MITFCDDPPQNPLICEQGKPGNEPSNPPEPGEDGTPPPNPFKLSFSFTPISHATANTDYISNPIVISEVDGNVNATISGANATLIQNGVDTGSTSTSVTNGDTLAIKTRSSSQGSVTQVTLTVGEKSTNWSITTDSIILPPELLGTASGYTAGEFQVNESGAATYTIPITAPPGTAGIQPKLSLNFGLNKILRKSMKPMDH